MTEDGSITNGTAIAWSELPRLEMDEWHRRCVAHCAGGARISALAALPTPEGEDLVAVLANDTERRLELLRASVPPDRHYPALTPELPQAQAFERELAEQSRLVPDGHPWPKALRRHAELEQDPRGMAAHPFFEVRGEGVHEVAVGPVHAGIIEPGHFRFQCNGETVLHLEIQLGYQHRGAEDLLTRSHPSRRLVVAESIAGDTSVGHALAHCMTVEALSGVEVPSTAQRVRSIALELERLANHVGDLGALCGDIGYLPGASWFGRLRGEFLNQLMEISGNRFGRGLLTPGGVRFGIGEELASSLVGRLDGASRDLERTAALTFSTPSVESRFEQTGIVSRQLADELGLVGPVARASGCDRDVRRDHPFGIHLDPEVAVPVSIAEAGDVMARARVRWLETQRSIAYVRDRMGEDTAGDLVSASSSALPDRVAVALVEGWRGELVHVAVSDAAGAIGAYKVVDPSFHNWFGLAVALRGNEISDFPLCNKSFNLSYAGHDL